MGVDRIAVGVNGIYTEHSCKLFHKQTGRGKQCFLQPVIIAVDAAVDAGKRNRQGKNADQGLTARLQQKAGSEHGSVLI